MVFMKKKYIIIILVLLLLVGIVCFLYRINYISHKMYTNDYFNIDTYISSVDMDNDGIDDQSDILNGARSYIETKPKYKSKYYNTGYPNDNYGVCTDVVIFSFLEAGYDLRSLVDNDIRLHNELYNIDNIDNNIDFRRVRNLEVYFKYNAISLTTDVYDIDSWQGGDVVIFKNHIGIVSDKRNKRGVTFVIQHANPYQKDYEEDILEYRDDIIGHYRVS